MSTTNLEPDDWSLLQSYVNTRSEPAFETLVRRYVNQVHAMALRLTGNTHLAQDVTQAVFLVLVRKASTLTAETVLQGWLFNTTRFVAKTVLRSEYRRVEREKSAMQDPSLNSPDTDVIWEQVSPHIDDALATLGQKDRNVVLLRFFHQRSVREVAERIGAGEAAAQKRITRAVEKIRRYLERQGVRVTGGSLILALSSQCVEAAPAALASSVVTCALGSSNAANVPTVTALAQATLKSMGTPKLLVPALLGIGTAALLLPLVGFWVLGRGPREREIYDVSRDFSLSSNPRGVWTFGWVPRIGGPFSALQHRQTVVVRGDYPIQSWQLGPGQNPAIYRNDSTSVWYHGQGTFPGGAIWFHAGDNGTPQNFGVIRFTVPDGAAPYHHVMAKVEPHFYPSFAGDTDFYVATNGVQVFGEFLPVDRGTIYTNVFQLSPGDTVDFLIGRGADGNEYASGLKIQATIEATTSR